MIRMTHGKPPGGALEALGFPRAGLNLAISAMVPSRWEILRRVRSVTIGLGFVLLAAVLGACGEKPKLPADLFPATAAGGWQLAGAHDFAEGESPDPVPRSAIQQERTATYKGPGQLEAHVYLLDAEQTGQVLAQRWRPSADTVFFNRGRYFVVIRWQQGDRRALQSFVAEFEKRLGAASGTKPGTNSGSNSKTK
jgi:hypothetical protein